MRLDRFPRAHLAQLPTPLEPMVRLGTQLGLPRLFVKRDDQTGLGLGGNKARKLEFLLGEALAQGADTVLTVGALQSNHARQTAAACARLGLDCELILRRSRHATESYLHNGNILLDRLFGARLTIIDAEADRDAAMMRRAAELSQQGARPYLIPAGGSCTTGDLGYAACAQELLQQTDALDASPVTIVVTTGSGGTHAGLVAGFHMLGAAVRVVGIAIESTRAEQEALVYGQAFETAKVLGAPLPLPRERVTVFDEYVGPGYAKPTQAMREAVALVGGCEGLALDPVYTGKAMSGLIGLGRGGFFSTEETIVFLHTGGAPALFAYPETLTEN